MRNCHLRQEVNLSESIPQTRWTLSVETVPSVFAHSQHRVAHPYRFRRSRRRE